MPPEPTFSRSHLSAHRNFLMATTTTTTRPLPHQVARPASPSCCYTKRYATRSQSESSPWSPGSSSSKDDLDARPTPSPASDSASYASSPAPSLSPLSSPPPSRPPSTSASPTLSQSQLLSPVPETGAKKDPDGTISPATIYRHYECVARRLFRVMTAERERRVANSHPNPTAANAVQTRPCSTAAPPRALDWPLSTSSFVGLGLPAAALDVLDAMTTTKALDELPISANSSLPEYQLTQEWFERVISELKEVEESKTAAAAAGREDAVTEMDADMEAEAEVAEHGKHQKQLDS